MLVDEATIAGSYGVIDYFRSLPLRPLSLFFFPEVRMIKGARKKPRIAPHVIHVMISSRMIGSK